MKSKLNSEVTNFLDNLKHPFRKEIDELRSIILSSAEELAENIKWNGPNYSVGEDDRVTMRIQPPKQIQLIFHRGAKVLKLPKGKLIEDRSGLMEWKTNDRAVITFKSMNDVSSARKDLADIVKRWVKSAR